MWLLFAGYIFTTSAIRIWLIKTTTNARPQVGEHFRLLVIHFLELHCKGGLYCFGQAGEILETTRQQHNYAL